MAHHPHLIIPFASRPDAQCQAAIQTLTLPRLSQLLQQALAMPPAARHTNAQASDAVDPMLPYERLLEHLGEQLGAKPSFVVTPCHWQVGMNEIGMDNPSQLQLTDHESRELLAALAPYFLEGGIILGYDEPLRWIAQGTKLDDFSLVSLERVIGQNVAAWQPKTAANQALHRLQMEVQMLLYTHPVNAAREAKGLPSVNSFWLSKVPSMRPAPQVTVELSLRENALRGNWFSWVGGWQAIENKALEAYRLASQQAQGLQLTLCGENHAKSFFVPAKTSWRHWAKRLVVPAPTLGSVLASL